MALNSFRFFASFQRYQRFSTGGKNVGGSGRKDDEHGTPKLDQKDANMDVDVGAINAKHMEKLFAKWLQDEASIHESWQKYFNEMVKENFKECSKDISKPDTDALPGAVKDLTKKQTEPESAHIASPIYSAKDSTSGQPIASNPDNPVVPLMAEKNSTKSTVDAPTMEYVDLFSKLGKSKAPPSIELPGSQRKSATTPTSYFDTIDPQSDIVIGPTILSPFVESSSSKDNKTTPPKTTTRELLGKISKNVNEKVEKAKKIMTKSQRLPKTLPKKNPQMLKTESKPKKSKKMFKILKTQIADDEKEAETQAEKPFAKNKNQIYLYKVGSSGAVDYFRPIPDRSSEVKSPLPGNKQLPKKIGTKEKDTETMPNAKYLESNMLNQNETLSTADDAFEASKTEKKPSTRRMESMETGLEDFELPEFEDKSLQRKRKAVDKENKRKSSEKNVKSSISVHKSVYKMANNVKAGSDSSEKKSRDYKASHKPGPSVTYRQLAVKHNKMKPKSGKTRTLNPIKLTSPETVETDSVDNNWADETDENTVKYLKKSEENKTKAEDTFTQEMESASDSFEKRQETGDKSPKDIKEKLAVRYKLSSDCDNSSFNPNKGSLKNTVTDESTIRYVPSDAKPKSAPKDSLGDDKTNPEE
ncbi:uncharacterized protein LOC117580533 [Drosophila guanche]|nr:uncharacterized protein LOC117580533 [Drosophila guanche]SPP76717.1 blast:Uncharacterized protein DDB_G0286299 [Drosophila guanche]